MHTYEKMLIDASNNGFEIVEKNFKSDAKGLCKGKKIGIRKDMSDTEKACVLAEELGHYYTSVGNILDQHDPNNQKQENIARRWATNILLCPADLIEACRAGNEYISDIAEYLGVTSEFLIDAINVFSAKYGPVYSDGKYEIKFHERGFNINKSVQA